jgi:predicted nucleotide-binding protein
MFDPSHRRELAKSACLHNPCHSLLASHAISLAGANETSINKVLLIQGHALDRNDVHDWLRMQQLAQPVVMVQEFTAGQSSPEKFESWAAETDAAIALATPDDLGSAAIETDITRGITRSTECLGRGRLVLGSSWPRTWDVTCSRQ